MAIVERVRGILEMKDAGDQEVIDELMSKISKRVTVSDAAPTDATPSYVHVKVGDATTDAVTVYAKYNDEWYGG